MPRGPADPFLVAFGRAVKDLRERRQLTQEQAAARIGVERTYLVDVEGGHRNITLRNLVRISSALGVDPSQLLAAAERRPDERGTPAEHMDLTT